MIKLPTLIRKTILPLSGSLISTIVTITSLQAHAINGWDAGVIGGTLGVLGEAGYRFNPTFGIRAQGGGYEYFQSELKYNGEKYHHVRYRPITAHFLADWYFLTSWWRLTGGIGLTWTKIHVRKNMTEEPFPRNLAGVVTLRYRYKNRVAPYVGTGVDFYSIPCGGKDSKFIFSLDIGINFQGRVKVRAKSTGVAQYIPEAMKIIHHEGNKLLNKNWWVRYYPVASLSIRYKI